MEFSPYTEVDKLIKEYEKDAERLNPNIMIIEFYPKWLVMLAVSHIEKQLKIKITNFINSLGTRIRTRYPDLHFCISSNARKPPADLAYAKLKGYDDDDRGCEVLNAERFYRLFGGNDFKTKIKRKFQNLKTEKISKLDTTINQYESIRDFESSIYLTSTRIKDDLKLCSFEIAEEAFLSLKLRRNRVAHDFLIHPFNYFNDIRTLYYQAMLYTHAIELVLDEMTA